MVIKNCEKVMRVPEEGSCRVASSRVYAFEQQPPKIRVRMKSHSLAVVETIARTVEEDDLVVPLSMVVGVEDLTERCRKLPLDGFLVGMIADDVDVADVGREEEEKYGK